MLGLLSLAAPTTPTYDPWAWLIWGREILHLNLDTRNGPVLIDRGGRELPIHADVVGKKVEVGDDERVDVMVAELDERTEVVIVPKSAA